MKELKTYTGIPLAEAFGLLDAQLEPGAYKEIKGGKGQKLGLTDIVPAYLPFTLNKIFGPIGIGWGFSVEDQNTKSFEVEGRDGGTRTEYTSSAKITVWYAGFDDMGAQQKFVLAERVPGGSSNSTLEWAMKGAVTNGLGSAWFFGGWQISVYMDKRGHDKRTDEDEEEAPRAVKPTLPASDFLGDPPAPAPKRKQPEAEPSSQLLDENKERPGADYVIPFGFQKGQKLGALPDATVNGALQWAKKNKPRDLKDFIDAATKYLNFSELDKTLGERVPVTEQKLPDAGDVTQTFANLKQSLDNSKTVADVKTVIERIREAFKAKAISTVELDELYRVCAEKQKSIDAPKKGKK